jgi:hypothetical protein
LFSMARLVSNSARVLEDVHRCECLPGEVAS